MVGAEQGSQIDKTMPYVSWVAKTEEDTAESRKQGKVVYRDRHYARVTPPGSKDLQFEPLPAWWQKCQDLADHGRMPRHWIDLWKRSYELFCKGQELPLDGTPIRGWSLMSGAMQETCIRYSILTVEQLANATDEALNNVGMGARDYKLRAQAWLKQNEDKSGLAIENAALLKENERLKKNLETVQKKYEDLKHKKALEAA